MEESIKEILEIPPYDVRTYSPLTLAFLGDAVYELMIRTKVVTRANTNPNQLNRQSSALAKASAQAQLLYAILPLLTPEETAVYKRGRNAHSATKAKNATVVDYRTATGFEALMGYLYLKDEQERAAQLVRAGWEALDKAGRERAGQKAPAGDEQADRTADTDRKTEEKE